MATPKIVLLSISSRRISKRPICFNLAPPQSRRTRDPDMLSAVGLSDIDCPCGQDKKSRRFYSDHQSTLVAIGIGRHVRVGSFASIPRCNSEVGFIPNNGHPSALPPIIIVRVRPRIRRDLALLRQLDHETDPAMWYGPIGPEIFGIMRPIGPYGVYSFLFSIF